MLPQWIANVGLVLITTDAGSWMRVYVVSLCVRVRVSCLWLALSDLCTIRGQSQYTPDQSTMLIGWVIRSIKAAVQAHLQFTYNVLLCVVGA